MNVFGFLCFLAGTLGGAAAALNQLTSMSRDFNLHQGFLSLFLLFASVGLVVTGAVFMAAARIVQAIENGQKASRNADEEADSTES